MKTKPSLIQRLHQAKEGKRKAVSPVIATLLLIAIAVAAGIIVYVFVSGLTTSLTSGGGGKQVAAQLEMVSHDAASGLGNNQVFVYVQNTGTSTLHLQFVYATVGTSLAQYTLNGAGVGITDKSFCVATVSGGTATCVAGADGDIAPQATVILAIKDTGNFKTANAGQAIALKAQTTDGSQLTIGSIVLNSVGS